MPLTEKTTSRITCPECELRLPLRMSGPGEGSALWICNRCERKFAAVYEPQATALESRRVRLSDTHFDTSNCPPVPPRINLLVERLADRDEARCQSELRRSRRIPKNLIVDAVCLDRSFVPDELPFLATVFDLSKHGLGLIHTEPLRSPYAAFQMRPDRHYIIQVFSKIVRCVHFDDIYYSIGCEFYSRLGDLRRVVR